MSTKELWNRTPSCLVIALMILVLGAFPVSGKNHYDRENARGNQVILHATPENARLVAEQHGLDIAGELNQDGEYLALLEAPESLTVEQVEDLLLGDPRVKHVSRVQLASLPSDLYLEPAQEHVETDLMKAGDFTTPCLSQGFSGLLWSGFADQEAAREIDLHAGHAANGDCGSAVVAVLDSGVDPTHPLLQDALISGYDFLDESAGIPEESWGRIDGTVAAILESSDVKATNDTVRQGEGDVMGERSANPLVDMDGTVAAILEVELQEARYYGHGTMVAGLVRLAAPAAKIMPLRVFGSSGQAHVFDVVRAIEYAVDHGADVISMSFSTETHSIELLQAIQYARSHGVVCVAAAGNQGQRDQTYPAAYPDVIGVASLVGETLTAFSNYGSNVVAVAAPGNGVISAFPGGLYGAGWGTSFSTPLVAGTMALLMHRYPDKSISTIQHMENALRQGSETIDSLYGEIGSGRLDVLGTVLEAQK